MSVASFVTSFIFIFLAAAPGRTTFILVLLASQGRFKDIYLGAGLAFFLQSMISVLLGGVLSLFPHFVMELVAGVLFIYFGYSFWKQSKEPIAIRSTDKNVGIKSVFWIVFMAEFGDVSQLAIAATAANSSSRLAVFVLAVIALWSITGLALWVGYNLKRLMDVSLIQKMASVAFVLMGLVLLVKMVGLTAKS